MRAGSTVGSQAQVHKFDYRSGGYSGVPQQHRIKRNFNTVGSSNIPELTSSGSAFRPPTAQRRLTAVLIVATLLTGLAACGGRDGPPPSDSEAVDVSVSAAGGPLQASGELEPTTVSVTVRDGSGTTVRFDDDNRADPDGATGRLEIPASTSGLQLTLHADTEYHFEARAADAADNAVAHGNAELLTSPTGSDSVALDLTSLLGAATLTTHTDVHSLLPGQELDLLLGVSPNARPDLLVPASDYEASYEVTNGELLDEDEHGARVRAGEASGSDLVVTVTATGSVLRGEAVEQGSVSATLRLPFSTHLSVDLDPPTLSGLEFDAHERVVRGVASDAVGVARLEVYDGPVLLASTDPVAVTENGSAEVAFLPGGTAFEAPIDLPSGRYSLTIFATGSSGNETNKDLLITMP